MRFEVLPFCCDQKSSVLTKKTSIIPQSVSKAAVTVAPSLYSCSQIYNENNQECNVNMDAVWPKFFNRGSFSIQGWSAGLSNLCQELASP